MPVQKADKPAQTTQQHITRGPNTVDYIIRIPALKDFFRFGVQKTPTKEKQLQRIKRLKEEKSPIPRILNWIPQVINWLDDAQDLLFSFLYLSRPLLKSLLVRMPTRFIPYVGWALLAADIMNLITQTLALSTTPAATKPRLLKESKDLKTKFKAPAAMVTQFLQRGGWRFHLGAWLQLAQASTTVTGYGLQLGPLMGFISESIWGAIQAARGKTVQFITEWSELFRNPKKQRSDRSYPTYNPKTETLRQKAARFLTNAYQHIRFWDLLSPEDHELCILATLAATHVIAEDPQPYDIDTRINTSLTAPLPTFTPHLEVTLAALKEMNIDPETDIHPFQEPSNNPPTLNDALNTINAQTTQWMRHIGELFAPDIANATGAEPLPQLLQLLHSQQAIHQQILWYHAQETADVTINYLTQIDPDLCYTPDTPLLTTYHLEDYYDLLGPIPIHKYANILINALNTARALQLDDYETLANLIGTTIANIGAAALRKHTTFDDPDHYKRELNRQLEKANAYLRSLPHHEQQSAIYIVFAPHITPTPTQHT